MKQTKIAILGIMLLFNGAMNTFAQQRSQKVGDNPTVINPSAALEVESLNKGVLLPRVANTAAVVAPTNGLIVYDISSNCIKAYENNVWSSCLSASSASGSSPSSQTVNSDCNSNGIDCFGLVFSIKLTNNTFSSAGPISFSTGDVVLSGLTGYAVTAVSPASATIAPGANQTITYTITQTNEQDGILTATWTKLGLSCSATKALGGIVAGNGNTMTVQNGLATTTGTHSGTNYTLSSYTTGQAFSENTACAGKYISAGYTAATCTGSVTGTSGTVYPLVLINGQCWMNRNSNEKPSTIPIAPSYSNSADVGWYGYYNSAASEPAAGYGLLYQFSAAMNNECGERVQGVCPTGFHIPSDCELQYLEHGQGMSISEQNGIAYIRANTSNNMGTPGSKLRSQGTGATNASGFNGLLSGMRGSDGVFYDGSSYGYFWSSTWNVVNSPISRTLGSNILGVARYNNSSIRGFSVRCLKD